MSTRLARHPWLPYALLGLLLATVAAGDGLRIVHVLQSSAPAYDYWLESTVHALTFGLVGAVVARNLRGNAVGWLLLGVGSASAALLLAGEYAMYGHFVRRDHLPGGSVSAWLSAVLAIAVLAAIPVAVLLFPDGRPVSRRWRPWVRLCVANGVLLMAGVGFAPGPLSDTGGIRNPFGILPGGSVTRIWLTVGPTVLIACAFAAVTSLVVRWRRATADGRQQLKWVAFAGATGPSAILLFSLLLPHLTHSRFGNLLWAFGLAVIPVAAGLSILRYRLYEIDRIVSRTVSYTLVTGLLVAVYVGLVTVVTRLTPTSNSLAVAGSTLAVAALFQPLRGRVQAAVDRRFNRSRYDEAQTVEAFSARLREQVDLDALEADLVKVVGETMQPSRVSLWLPERAGVVR